MTARWFPIGMILGITGYPDAIRVFQLFGQSIDGIRPFRKLDFLRVFGVVGSQVGRIDINDLVF
jgi:hypothetical protein